MLRDLLLALGLPLLLLLITVLALQHPGRPATQLLRFAAAAPRLLPIGVGLILALSLLRWLLQR